MSRKRSRSLRNPVSSAAAFSRCHWGERAFYVRPPAMRKTKTQPKPSNPYASLGWALVVALWSAGAADQAFAVPAKSFVVNAEQPNFDVDDVTVEFRPSKTTLPIRARPSRAPLQAESSQTITAKKSPLKVEIETHMGHSFLFVRVRRDGQNMVVRVPLHDHDSHAPTQPQQVAAPAGAEPTQGPDDVEALPNAAYHRLDVGPLCVSYWESGEPIDDCRLPGQ